MYTIHVNENSPPSAAFQLLSDAINHIEQPRFNRHPNSLIRSESNNQIVYTRKDKFFAAYNLFADKLTVTL